MLPTISILTKRAKPRAKPVVSAGAPKTTSAAPSVPSSGAPNAGAGPATPPSMASQMTVSGADLNARPVTRPGEIVEATPGLIVTQHSGEGKANQYFLRGYNLDHGTDLAVTVDDMPINMRTHAHGQGYSDLNFLMPEIVNSLEIRKGPYFADVGDFGSVGALNIGLVDSTPKKTASLTVGSFSYQRLFGMASTPAGNGNLFFAGELAHYDGPWQNPDDARKVNGMVRYSQGTADNGFTITGMAYANKWNSTDQVPLRAIASGQLDRFGEIDPTDGGNANRFSLSARVVKSDDAGWWKANFYAVRSTLDLYNNFTWFLNDPVNGDQFHQHDGRTMVGGNASRTHQGTLGGVRTETTLGIQTRYDDIDLGLTNTFQRTFLSNIRSDRVGESSVGVYAESTLYWTDWLRTTLGWRGDYYDGKVDSIFDANNSGHTKAAIGSPKFRMVLGPFNRTELFFGAGMGFHSNDARGATITESPTDRMMNLTEPTMKLGESPLLVRTRGAEAGVRTRILPGLDSSVSLFILDQASELLFSGDAGDTTASRPSERYGIEWTNRYRPMSWVHIDADLALTHARFIGFDEAQAQTFASLATSPQAQIGNAPGDFIPNAPAMVASAGITLGGPTGWFGTLRWRYLGPSPLTEDGAFRSPSTSIFNGRLGYRFDNGWRIQIDALNVFNTKTNQINYAYGSLLKTDALFNKCFPVQVALTAVCQAGVMDYILHPAEPLAIRVSLIGVF
jgi:outer membrane receptor protein involved in Fe transport